MKTQKTIAGYYVHQGLGMVTYTFGSRESGDAIACAINSRRPLEVVFDDDSIITFERRAESERA
jgi:hypothetical protein